MSSTLSTNVTDSVTAVTGGWDLAICEAKTEILKAQARIDSLRVSVANFEEFKASGEPFPGQESKRKRKRKELD